MTEANEVEVAKREDKERWCDVCQAYRLPYWREDRLYCSECETFLTRLPARVEPAKARESLIEQLKHIRSASIAMLDALILVQPYVNGWMGSEEGKHIAAIINAAVVRAKGQLK